MMEAELALIASGYRGGMGLLQGRGHQLLTRTFSPPGGQDRALVCTLVTAGETLCLSFLTCMTGGLREMVSRKERAFLPSGSRQHCDHRDRDGQSAPCLALPQPRTPEGKQVVGEN